MEKLVVKEGKGAGAGSGSGRKRGPRPKDQVREYVLKEDQRKFTVDLMDDVDQRQMIFNLLMRANSKPFGREIIFKDLVIYAFAKITDKDIAKIQECSLTSKEKAERVVAEYNQKHGTRLSLEEFILCRDGK